MKHEVFSCLSNVFKHEDIQDFIYLRSHKWEREKFLGKGGAVLSF